VINTLLDVMFCLGSHAGWPVSVSVPSLLKGFGDIPRPAVRHSDTDTWKCNSAFYATFRPERTSDSKASREKVKVIIEGVEKKRM
jgi:hypothetical protein